LRCCLLWRRERGTPLHCFQSCASAPGPGAAYQKPPKYGRHVLFCMPNRIIVVLRLVARLSKPATCPALCSWVQGPSPKLQKSGWRGRRLSRGISVCQAEAGRVHAQSCSGCRSRAVELHGLLGEQATTPRVRPAQDRQDGLVTLAWRAGCGWILLDLLAASAGEVLAGQLPGRNLLRAGPNASRGGARDCLALLPKGAVTRKKWPQRPCSWVQPRAPMHGQPLPLGGPFLNGSVPFDDCLCGPICA
jgi:hypothetical protein